jgi:GT2 family glycosyltransferase
VPDTTASPLIGLVVPTLGTRPDFLEECLRSVRDAGPCVVVVVRPPSAAQIDAALEGWADVVVDDPGAGLAAAINRGIAALADDVGLATWLGDDDRLTANSLVASSNAMAHDGSVLAFGQCQYIDATGKPIWLNRSGRWTVPLMKFGPQLVPQPGSLFSRTEFDALGGLDEGLRWAFDLDLFLKLREAGRFSYVARPLGEFRWHEGSLSVGSRRGSVEEASLVRRRHLGRIGRAVSPVSEPAIRWAISTAGRVVSSMARRRGASSPAHPNGGNFGAP